MKVYLMRHGETAYNKQGLIQGSLDIPLNEYGLELAKMTRNGFNKDGLSFDICYCSPLTRAKQTAEILLKGTNTKMICDDRIREMNFGEGEGVLIKELPIRPEYANIDAVFHHPSQYRATENSESFESLLARVQDFLENELIPLERKYDKILVSCHGGVIRAFIAVIKKLHIDHFWDSHQPNCCVNILEIKNQSVHILEEHKLYYTLPEEKKGSIL